MTINGNQLLSALGSGIIPGGSGLDTKHVGGPNFEEIMSRVLGGKPSGVGVEIADGLFPDAIPAEALERVGRAADLAAIEGIDRAVVDLGQSLLRLDVRNRMIEAQIEPGGGEIVSGVDGFISIERPDSPESEAISDSGEAIQSGPLIPARVVRNASLASLLSE